MLSEEEKKAIELSNVYKEKIKYELYSTIDFEEEKEIEELKEIAHKDWEERCRLTFKLEEQDKELEQKEKIIDEMSIALAETDFDKCCDNCHTDICTASEDIDERAECCKRYFIEKAGGEDERNRRNIK